MLYNGDANIDRVLGSCKKCGDYYSLEDNIFNSYLLGQNNINALSVGDKVLVACENLYDYQVRDVAKMVSNKHMLNRNTMGFGKTPETIIALRNIDARSVVIVAPKVVLRQWQEKIEQWWPDRAKDTVIFSNRTKVAQGKIYLINYEKFTSFATLERFKAFIWDCIVLDEAHKIKNRKSKRSKMIKLIPAKRKYLLTGTPILNKPDDLWSILNFFGDWYSGKSFWAFQQRFCEIEDGFFGKKVVGLTKNEDDQKLLKDVLHLISVYNEPRSWSYELDIDHVSLDMSSAQKKLYTQIKQLIFEELPEDLTVPNGAVMGMRLSQITTSPSMWQPEVWGVKFEYIKEWLENNPTEKLVVFSTFAKSCSELVSFLNQSGIKSAIYTGEYKDHEKYEEKINFINDPKVRALVGTIGAMGEGVDGLQECCNNMMFLNRDWSPEINKQAIARLHRIGQSKRVYVQYLECTNSYDKYVGKVNLTKTEDIRRILADEDSSNT